MKKLLILSLMVIGSVLNADTLYVGDTASVKYYMDTNDESNKLAEKYQGNDTIVLCYVKIDENGKPQLSSESKCCSSKTVALGASRASKCIPLKKAINKVK